MRSRKIWDEPVLDLSVRLAVTLALLALAVVISNYQASGVACGAGSGEPDLRTGSGKGGTDQVRADNESRAEAFSPGECAFTLTLRSGQVDPPRLVVNRGDVIRLRVVNRERIPHSLTSVTGNGPDMTVASEAVQEIRWTPQESGNVKLVCSLVQDMQLQIQVR